MQIGQFFKKNVWAAKPGIASAILATLAAKQKPVQTTFGAGLEK